MCVISMGVQHCVVYDECMQGVCVYHQMSHNMQHVQQLGDNTLLCRIAFSALSAAQCIIGTMQEALLYHTVPAP
jgi:hypothetical protein